MTSLSARERTRNDLIRIAAFAAICATLPVGSVAVESEANERRRAPDLA
jgi:hypothetical protein